MPFDATPIKTNTTADVLRRARALIDSPEKWIKGAYGLRADDPHCVYGALDVVAHMRPCRGFELFREAVGTRHIEAWNDAPERTHAEVMAAFDRAIELAEAEG
jgi:hypothetical protein